MKDIERRPYEIGYRDGESNVTADWSLALSDEAGVDWEPNPTEVAQRIASMLRIVEAAKAADLFCLVYGDQDMTCIQYREDFKEEWGSYPSLDDEPLCDHCAIWSAVWNGIEEGKSKDAH